MEARIRLAKLAGQLRGGERASALASGACLGLITGLTAGAHLTSCALLVAAAVARVNLPIWGLALTVGTLLGWAAAPLLYLTGWLILDWLGLRYALALLGESLPVALWDGNRYALIGGLAWGLGLGVIAARVVRRQARRRLKEIRRGPAEVLSLSEGRPTAIARGSAWFLTRLAWGSSRAPSPAALSRSWRVVAPSQVLGLLLVVAWAIVGYHWRAQALVRELFQDRLAQVAGSRWSFAEVEYAPLSGELVAQGVRVAWATDEGSRALVCDQLTARFEPGPAWLGRLALREVTLAGLHPLESGAAGPPTAVPVGRSTPAFGADERANSAASWELVLERWLATWVRDEAPWDQVQSLVRALERLAQHDLESADLETAHPLDWLACRRRRAELDWHRARLEIARLEISDLDPGWGWPASTRLELSGISSRPVVSGRPTPLLVLVPESRLALELELKLHELGQRHPLRIEATDVDLTDICQRAPAAERVRVARGRLHLSATGWADGERLDLAGEVRPRQLQLELAGDEPWEGRSASQWNQALAQLPTSGLPLALRGPWTAPELAFDAGSWRAGLAAAWVRIDAGRSPESAPAAGAVPSAEPETTGPVEIAATPDAAPDDREYVAATLDAFAASPAPTSQPVAVDATPPLASVPRRAAPPSGRPPVVAAVPAAEEPHPEFTADVPAPRGERRSTTVDVGDALSRVVTDESSSTPSSTAALEPGRLPAVLAAESAPPPAEPPRWPTVVAQPSPSANDPSGLEAFAGPTTPSPPQVAGLTSPSSSPASQWPAAPDELLTESPPPPAATPRAETLPPWLAPRVAVRAARAAGEKVPRVPGPIDLPRGASPPRAVPAWPGPIDTPTPEATVGPPVVALPEVATPVAPRPPRTSGPPSAVVQADPLAVPRNEPATEATEIPAEPEWSTTESWPEVPPLSGDPFGDAAAGASGDGSTEPPSQAPNGWLARLRRGLGERARSWRAGSGGETVEDPAPDSGDWPSADSDEWATAPPPPRSARPAPLAERRPNDGPRR